MSDHDRYNRYDPFTYGQVLAPIFDECFSDGPTDDCLRLLREKVGDPPADILELGIGTGRLALPLALEGYNVSGVEASPRMASTLRAKTPGERVRVIVGDFAEVEFDGPYDLIYSVESVLCILYPRERLLGCLRRVARSLKPGGRFVCDGMLPPRSQAHLLRVTSTRKLRNGGRLVADYKHDPAEQLLWGTTSVMLPDGREYCAPIRAWYNWPAQLDEVAGEAGLVLTQRARNWRGQPMDAKTTLYISTFARA
jgi:SAM-dependent methyltransferase